ncbi:MAG: hypothetical protein Q9191_000775 [Dirinaria sp. TL-2023a]
MAESLKIDSSSRGGYLDNTLRVFERHKHPFVLVGTLAKRWSGCGHNPTSKIDVLVRSSSLLLIVDELIASSDWELPSADELQGLRNNNSGKSETWLKFGHEHILFQYLRLWPEEVYHLSLECEKIEVPGIFTKPTDLMEEEYDRDPYHRFALPTRSRIPESELLPIPPLRAKSDGQDSCIYIPSIKAHLNALLQQRITELITGIPNGGDPRAQLRDLIRYLVLDWKPTRKWILDTKIEPQLRETMELIFRGFTRKKVALWDKELGKSVFGKMPWELTISREIHSTYAPDGVEISAQGVPVTDLDN